MNHFPKQKKFKTNQTEHANTWSSCLREGPAIIIVFPVIIRWCPVIIRHYGYGRIPSLCYRNQSWFNVWPSLFACHSNAEARHYFMISRHDPSSRSFLVCFWMCFWCLSLFCLTGTCLYMVFMISRIVCFLMFFYWTSCLVASWTLMRCTTFVLFLMTLDDCWWRSLLCWLFMTGLKIWWIRGTLEDLNIWRESHQQTFN